VHTRVCRSVVQGSCVHNVGTPYCSVSHTSTTLYLSVEYHTLYGVDRTRLTTRLPVTVLGKDSQYGRILCGMCCEMSGPERSSQRQ